MSKLILMRHGQSAWNKHNLFTGWVDISLSPEGIQEAFKGGEKIRDIPVDIVFTSSLVRAQTTAVLALSLHISQKPLIFLHKGKMKRWGRSYEVDIEKSCIPAHISWHLNERYYGKLQGINKTFLKEKFGEEQVQIWRRSFDVRPPHGESLADTAKRTLPYFKKKILPLLAAGKNILISAHGNSLRSIVMFMDNLSEEEVVHLEIPTGDPLLYEYCKGTFLKI